MLETSQSGNAPQAAGPSHTPPPQGQTMYVRRFDAYDRLLHGALMASFLGLAATGLPLLFSDQPWARRMAHVLGSFEVAGWLHRVSALVLIAVFALHLIRVGKRIVVKRDFGVLWGPGSMVPQLRDARDFVQHVKWFFGRGPRPRFDRYTYWEKFDYWAVFWGMGIIGGSGLLLWFPVFFARFVPGSVFNIAMLVHGEEALLAVGFIFTIHFFNTHLRPEKFPVDRVIFTGSVTTQELAEERPDEFARLERTGTLEAWRASPPEPWLGPFSSFVAVVVVGAGLALLGLILYAVIR